MNSRPSEPAMNAAEGGVENALTHFVELTSNTLQVMRIDAGAVCLSRNAALDNKAILDLLLNDASAGWQENGWTASLATFLPSISWHMVDENNVRNLGPDTTLGTLAGSLPHGLGTDTVCAACSAGTGASVEAGGDDRWVVAVAPAERLAKLLAQTERCRLRAGPTGPGVLDHVGAISRLLRTSGQESIALWELALESSHLFLVTANGIEAVVPCTIKLTDVWETIRAELNLKYQLAAARLFYGDLFDFTDAAPRIAGQLAPALESAIEALPGKGQKPTLACAGLTPTQNWLATHLAAAIGTTNWQPDPEAALSEFGLHVGGDLSPGQLTPSTFGLLHRIAAATKGSNAWQPVWEQTGAANARIALTAPAKPAPAPQVFVAPPEPPKPVAPVVKAAAPVPTPVPRPAAPAPVAKAPEAPKAPPAPAPKPLPAPAAKAPALIPRPAQPTPQPTAKPVPAPVQPVAKAPTPAPVANRAPTPAPAPKPAAPAPKPAEVKPAPVQPAAKVQEAPKPPEQKAAPAPAPKPAPASAQPVAKATVPAPAAKAATPAPATSRPETVSGFPEKKKSSLGLIIAIAAVVVLGGGFFAFQQYQSSQAEAARKVEQAKAEETRKAEQAKAEEARKAEKAKADAEMARLRKQAEEAATALAAVSRRQQDAEAAKRAAEEALARAPGVVMVSSDPVGAEISIDGGTPQSTPAVITGVAPGLRNISVRLAGYEPVDQLTQVKGAQTVDLGVIHLARQYGALTLHTDPADAEFAIYPAEMPDGTALRTGRTPARVDHLLPGDYVIKFNRSGLLPTTEHATISGSGTTDVGSTFIVGGVSITSNPPGATVRMNGEVIGVTPIVRPDLTPGNANFELTLQDHETVRLSGSISNRETLRLHGEMLPVDRLAKPSEIKTPPKALKSEKPVLPEGLILTQVEEVVVSVIVSRNGQLRDFRVDRTTNPALTDACLKSLQQWKFSPAIGNGNQALNVRLSIPFRFTPPPPPPKPEDEER